MLSSGGSLTFVVILQEQRPIAGIDGRCRLFGFDGIVDLGLGHYQRHRRMKPEPKVL